MRTLEAPETEQVSGGNGWGEGGLVVIGLGLGGGPVTAGFGLFIGGAMLTIDVFMEIH